jgi:hypothetical protein
MERHLDHFGQMHPVAAGAVENLFAATETIGNNQGFRVGLPYARI